MPRYLTLEEVEEAGLPAFIFVETFHDDDPAAVIWRDGHYFYQEHLEGDLLEHPDESELKLTAEQVFEGLWVQSAADERYMHREWRHPYGCDCQFCKGSS